MGAREAIAKAIVEAANAARRTDLPTRVYHGTGATFPAFRVQQMEDAGSISRALGVHVAPDPALASSFPDRYIRERHFDNVAPQMLPLRIPADNSFLQAVQPVHGYMQGKDLPNIPPWQKVASDDYAVQQMAALKAFPQDPAMLARYLEQAHAVPPEQSAAMASQLVGGGSVDLPAGDGPHDLARLVSNYGGRPYNDADRQRVVDLARNAWQDEGYKGIRYINTAPGEAGAEGVKDPTSYIVFDPKNIRSEFAQMSSAPEAMASSDLLRGMAMAPVGLGTLAAQDQYSADRAQ